ncbi:ABC transporter ATP-binding protein [Nocardioides zeae]|uniref:ABC transporter ATP-binding protein n=1 Tax=Nocardioides imazamoxiresistens TaxID=3231893 RepID=A0ABU3PRZ0_9ACTN|nr:ABC transporter ATP-binding protein [Nocardioides zeae]MDT9591642.1 ABC transporter ATP-binding protein [Nocardioides zeae]
MLEITDLTVTYPGGAEALHGVSLSVPTGRVTTVLGGNGAGKTSLLRAVGGLLPQYRASVRTGSVSLDGEDVTALPPWQLVRRGLAQVLEGRHIFTDLTVRDNLVVGGQGLPRREVADAVERAYEQFPALRDKATTSAGYLSGGEQQMLAIARATLRLPRLLLLDEPSLGLSPLMGERIATAIADIAAQGVTVLLVEQNARLALSISEQAVVIANGNVVTACPAVDLLDDDKLSAAYLGGAAAV